MISAQRRRKFLTVTNDRKVSLESCVRTFSHFDFLAAATKTRTRSSLAKRRRSWQMNRKQQEQNLVGIPPAAREKKSYRPAHGQVNSPVYLPALSDSMVGMLGYFESELLLDFGSVLSWLGSVLFGIDDELPD
jgi:hypothetical protein